MLTPLEESFRDRKVLVTGHTGFKGSWLCLWLHKLGAVVTGYAHTPAPPPNHHELLQLPSKSIIGDVRDVACLSNAMVECQPEVVFHLAAQPLVRRSYREPLETFSSNVIGTFNVLEAVRGVGTVKAVVCVTSDKVYENIESPAGYQESDRLGGLDPYSCSKACAELVTASFQSSYMPPSAYGRLHQTLIATARAGNVIGGGDWSEDRLVCDAVRAASSGTPMRIRNPHAIRPWQHVLEPLSGYLLLASALLAGRTEAARAWNFGPDYEGEVSVGRMVAAIHEEWPALHFEVSQGIGEPHETEMLKLNSDRARNELRWSPVWSWRDAIRHTIEWYRRFYESGEINSAQDLERFEQAAMAPARSKTL